MLWFFVSFWFLCATHKCTSIEKNYAPFFLFFANYCINHYSHLLLTNHAFIFASNIIANESMHFEFGVFFFRLLNSSLSQYFRMRFFERNENIYLQKKKFPDQLALLVFNYAKCWHKMRKIALKFQQQQQTAAHLTIVRVHTAEWLKRITIAVRNWKCFQFVLRACAEMKRARKKTSRRIFVISCRCRCTIREIVSSSFSRPCHSSVCVVCSLSVCVCNFFFLLSFVLHFIYFFSSNIFFSMHFMALLVLMLLVVVSCWWLWWSSVVIQPHTRLDTC